MKLLIIDSSGFFHRCFHAFPIDPAAQLRYTLQLAIDAYQPDRVISALDAGRETFRQRIYPGYKANRPPTPEGYSDAIPAMLQVLDEFGEKIAVKDYEADDICGALCEKHDDCEIRILSRDKDLQQLVREHNWKAGRTRVYKGTVEQHDDVTGITYNEAGVIEKWGIRPHQIPDVLGLAGDASDSIPGVVGVGIKVATALIQYFGTIDHLYEDLTSVSYLYKNSDKIIKKLEAGKELAFMSKDLATIRRNCLD